MQKDALSRSFERDRRIYFRSTFIYRVSFFAESVPIAPARYFATPQREGAAEEHDKGPRKMYEGAGAVLWRQGHCGRPELIKR